MRILIADDEKVLAEALTEFVQSRGHEVVATVISGGLDVIHAYNRLRPDLILMDVMMPKFNGVTACRAVLSRNPEAKIVLISGKLDAVHPIMVDTGAIGFLNKPVDFFKLEQVLAEVEASFSQPHFEVVAA